MNNFVNKIKPEVDEAIAKTCIKIIQEPLIYFSEADFQQFLTEELKVIKDLNRLYPTSVPKGKGATSVYKTYLMHREYGGGDNKRIDIVIFDPEDVRTIDEVNLKSASDYLKPVFIFELGTEKTSDLDKHLKQDIEKGLTVKPGGVSYIIQIFKDTTKSATGTDLRENTEDKINNKFKRVFAEKSSIYINDPSIKILAILIRTYRHQEKMWGKCEIYNNGNWEKTNVNNKAELKDKILKQLV